MVVGPLNRESGTETPLEAAATTARSVRKCREIIGLRKYKLFHIVMRAGPRQVGAPG
jgi:hypothetical protein